MNWPTSLRRWTMRIEVEASPARVIGTLIGFYVGWQASKVAWYEVERRVDA